MSKYLAVCTDWGACLPIPGVTRGVAAGVGSPAKPAAARERAFSVSLDAKEIPERYLRVTGIVIRQAVISAI